MRQIIILTGLFLFVFNLNGMPLNEASWLDKKLQRIYEMYSPPSISAAIINKKGIVEIGAIGLRKLGSPERVNVSDQYHIGSITKSFTALLAAILVKEGRIDWKTRLVDLFPGIKSSKVSEFDKITLRSLLFHTAGITPFQYRQDWRDVPLFKGNLIEQRKKFLFWLFKNKKTTTFGEFNYSNAGYDIAASMIEKVTNKSWEQLMVQKVFRKLNLETAGFGDPAKNDPSKVWGHWQRWIGKTPTVPVPPDKYALNSLDAPSGDIHMSIRDLAIYAQFHLKGLGGTDQFLECHRIGKIHQSDDHYSFGWFIKNILNQKVSIHWGSNGMFIAGILISHDADLAVVVMSNSSDRNSKKACRVLISSVIGRYNKNEGKIL